jgi:diaminopimelate decarboxylase
VTGFALVDGELTAERVPLSSIAAQFGTPCFVYSRAALEGAWREFDAAFADLPHLICYAMKANSNLAVLDLYRRLGSGFDIVSGGELARAIAAGADPGRIVFSGVGKTEGEMQAALAAGILCFNVESPSELARLAAVAARIGSVAPVSFRVNPDVDPRTHPYIATGLRESKFGVAHAAAPQLYRQAAALPSIAVRGIDMHIGSQITELAPYREAVARILALVDALAADGIAISHVDVGGGLGIRYRDETPVALADYAAMLRTLFRDRRERLILEPGRRLVVHQCARPVEDDVSNHAETLANHRWQAITASCHPPRKPPSGKILSGLPACFAHDVRKNSHGVQTDIASASPRTGGVSWRPGKGGSR